MSPLRFAFCAFVLLTPAAHADEIAPGCDADLAALDASFDETMSRLQKATASDKVEKCAAITHHIEVMMHAAEVFDRCLPEGHDKRENMGQVLGTAADFRDIMVGEECPVVPDLQ
jgi:hypothetical protein